MGTMQRQRRMFKEASGFARPKLLDRHGECRNQRDAFLLLSVRFSRLSSALAATASSLGEWLDRMTGKLKGGE